MSDGLGPIHGFKVAASASAALLLPMLPLLWLLADPKMFGVPSAARPSTVAELEEENHVLKQRDVMHRMIALETDSAEQEKAAAPAPTGGDAKPAEAKPAFKLQISKRDLVTFAPFAMEGNGFGQQVEAPTSEREQTRQTQQIERSGSYKSDRSRLTTRWTLLRAPIWWKARTDGRWVDKRKIHPARAPRVHQPKKKLSAMGPEERKHEAATRIQAVWRGYMERKDLDYWDQYTDFY